MKMNSDDRAFSMREAVVAVVSVLVCPLPLVAQTAVRADNSAKPTATAGGTQYGFANGTSARAARPGFNGQLVVANDGYVGIAGGGKINDLLVVSPNLTYFLPSLANTDQTKELAWSGPARTGRLQVNVPKGLGYIDNAIDVQNLSGGYSSVSLYAPADGGLSPGNSAAIAIAYGPAGSGEYCGKAFIGINPKAGVGTCPDFGIYQEQAGAAYYAHRRLYFDAAHQLVTCYGWTTNSHVGPIGWQVNGSGFVTMPGSLTLSGSTNSTTNPTLTISAVAGQAAPLTRWTDSAGKVVGSIDSSGTLTVRRIAISPQAAVVPDVRQAAQAVTLALPSKGNVLEITGTGARSVKAFTGGTARQTYTVVNVGAGNVTLTHSPSLVVRGGANLVLQPNEGCTLYVRSPGNYSVW
jgi:hypothetical protein